MIMASLADYLASKYLTADNPKKSKKRKRSERSGESAGLVVADDDVMGWEKKKLRDNDEDGDVTPITGTSFP